jgi:hypothetical protein
MVKPAPAHSDQPSGVGHAVGEIENPVRDLPCGPEGISMSLINRPDIRAQTSVPSLSRYCRPGGVHIRGWGEGEYRLIAEFGNSKCAKPPHHDHKWLQAACYTIESG